MTKATFADCPLFTYSENHKLDQEINNICQQIQNPVGNNLNYSTGTFIYLTSKVITVDSMTVNYQVSANLPMGNHKITNLANGTASTDAAAFGQLFLFQAPVYCATNSNFTTTSASYVTTNLTCTITPTSSSNRVLVLTHAVYNGATGGTDVSIFRGSSDLGPAGGQGFVFLGNNQRYTGAPFIIDSPATTSATTYSIKMKDDSGAATSSMGLNGETQTMVLMEVK